MNGWATIMKVLLLLALLLPLGAQADIYKCKDSQQKLVYQDTPCAIKSVGKIAPVAPLSQADELRAKERLDRLLEQNRYSDQRLREDARLRQQELLRLEALEEREREAALVQREQGEVYIPMYGPGYHFGRSRHHDRPPVVTPRVSRRPCVIGFVGDKSCR